jgi:hypothetical protein
VSVLARALVSESASAWEPEWVSVSESVLISASASEWVLALVLASAPVSAAGWASCSDERKPGSQWESVSVSGSELESESAWGSVSAWVPVSAWGSAPDQRQRCE